MHRTLVKTRLCSSDLQRHEYKFFLPKHTNFAIFSKELLEILLLPLFYTLFVEDMAFCYIYLQTSILTVLQFIYFMDR